MISRTDIAYFVLGYAGTSSTNERAEDYLNLLSRGKETQQMRKDMGRMSSCALFLRAVWWFLGLDHPIYEMPYKDGQAPADILKIAKSKGAIIEGPKLSKSCYPKTGDGFYIASGGKREHFGIITKEIQCTYSNTWKYETVEGGQGAGGRAIEKCYRTITKQGMWGLMGDRSLISWFDADKLNLPGLRTEEPIRVPDGYKKDPYE